MLLAQSNVYLRYLFTYIKYMKQYIMNSVYKWNINLKGIFYHDVSW